MVSTNTVFNEMAWLRETIYIYIYTCTSYNMADNSNKNQTAYKF